MKKTKRKVQKEMVTMKIKWTIIACVIIVISGILLFLLGRHFCPNYDESNTFISEGHIVYIGSRYMLGSNNTYIVLDTGETFFVGNNRLRNNEFHLRELREHGTGIVRIQYAKNIIKDDAYNAVGITDENHTYLSIEEVNSSQFSNWIAVGFVFLVISAFVIIWVLAKFEK